jgi:hypothetical protein
MQGKSTKITQLYVMSENVCYMYSTINHIWIPKMYILLFLFGEKLKKNTDIFPRCIWLGVSTRKELKLKPSRPHKCLDVGWVLSIKTLRHVGHIKIQSLSLVDVIGRKKTITWITTSYSRNKHTVHKWKKCWRTSMANKYVVARKDGQNIQNGDQNMESFKRQSTKTY